MIFQNSVFMLKYFGVHVIYSTVYVAMYFSTFQSICTTFQSDILVFSLHNRDTLDLFCFEQRVVYPREL